MRAHMFPRTDAPRALISCPRLITININQLYDECHRPGDPPTLPVQIKPCPKAPTCVAKLDVGLWCALVTCPAPPAI